MVASLGVAFDEAQGLFGIACGVANGVEEEFARRMVGAAEGGEVSAGIQEAKGAQVDFLVAAHGVVEGLFVAGEGGRIEDDEIILFSGFFAVTEIVKGVGCFDLERKLIALCVGLCG